RLHALLIMLFLNETRGGRLHDKRMAEATTSPGPRGVGSCRIEASWPARCPGPGTDDGGDTRQPGPAPPSAADCACPQEREALSHRQRPEPRVEGGRPGIVSGSPMGG